MQLREDPHFEQKCEIVKQITEILKIRPIKSTSRFYSILEDALILCIFYNYDLREGNDERGTIYTKPFYEKVHKEFKLGGKRTFESYKRRLQHLKNYKWSVQDLNALLQILKIEQPLDYLYIQYNPANQKVKIPSIQIDDNNQYPKEDIEQQENQQIKKQETEQSRFVFQEVNRMQIIEQKKETVEPIYVDDDIIIKKENDERDETPLLHIQHPITPEISLLPVLNLNENNEQKEESKNEFVRFYEEITNLQYAQPSSKKKSIKFSFPDPAEQVVEEQDSQKAIKEFQFNFQDDTQLTFLQKFCMKTLMSPEEVQKDLELLGNDEQRLLEIARQAIALAQK